MTTPEVTYLPGTGWDITHTWVYVQGFPVPTDLPEALEWGLDPVVDAEWLRILSLHRRALIALIRDTIPDLKERRLRYKRGPSAFHRDGFVVDGPPLTRDDQPIRAVQITVLPVRKARSRRSSVRNG